MITITQKRLKLIKNLFFITVLLLSVNLAAQEYRIENPAKNTITLRLALTREEHQKGLSGIKPNQFKSNEGMLFINERMGVRKFWMPDTYFNLAIIFLDENLRIVGIESTAPKHPGHKEPPAIYRTNEYLAQFVLETKSNVQFSKKLKVGDQLKWKSKISLSEITQGIRH